MVRYGCCDRSALVAPLCYFRGPTCRSFRYGLVLPSDYAVRLLHTFDWCCSKRVPAIVGAVFFSGSSSSHVVCFHSQNKCCPTLDVARTRLLEPPLVGILKHTPHFQVR
ncbi:unnamed protein product, partial [Ectocarpus fasciculatus]